MITAERKQQLTEAYVVGRFDSRELNDRIRAIKEAVHI